MNPPNKPSLSHSHNQTSKNVTNSPVKPIKVIKNNDNTNNWHTVPLRSPTSYKAKIQKINSFTSQNRFLVLADNEKANENENDIEMQTQENAIVQPKIPPIYITDNIDYFDFCKKIKPLTDPEGFNTKNSSSGLKLMTYSINAYRKTIKFVEKIT
jgi:hypothetical protein